MALTLLQRQRRVGKLCCHCVRNLAYYFAWHEKGKPHAGKDFWVSANGNFVEISLLEWCKLFGEWKGAYHYRKVVDEAHAFRAAMLNKIGKTQDEWDAYVKSMKDYRDKYVAHWEDDIDGAHLPVMDIARDSAIYLMDFLTEHGEDDVNWPVPQDGAAFYEQRKADALAACDAAYT
jgi:hypothetical protein